MEKQFKVHMLDKKKIGLGRRTYKVQSRARPREIQGKVWGKEIVFTDPLLDKKGEKNG